MKKQTDEFRFLPGKAVRAFLCQRFVGRVVKFSCHNQQRDGGCAWWAVGKIPTGSMSAIRGPALWGWQHIPNAHEGMIIERKIVACYLMEAANGGRSDSNRYGSYRDYYGEARKAICQRMYKAAGIAEQLVLRGNPDAADMFVQFDDGEILTTRMYDLCAPEEWYSEVWDQDPRFEFKDGFYPDAASAIEAFQAKAQDDLFGTRYFPVLVFPCSRGNRGRDIVQTAKNWSQPILVGDRVAFGTRCKPDEYAVVIARTYRAGGRVPINVEWDW